VVQVSIDEIKPEIAAGLLEKTVGHHAGKGAVPAYTAMDGRRLGQPEFTAVLHLKTLSIKNGRVLTGRVHFPVGRQGEKSLQMLGQELEHRYCAFLGPHQVRVYGKNGVDHYLLTVVPIIAAVLGVGEAEIEGQKAHSGLRQT
jgi:hypothetical protein